jgi:hypothetical protein
LSEKTAATAPTAAAGVTSTGHHIIRLPKLARSCSSQISAPATKAPTAVMPASERWKPAVRWAASAQAAGLLK